MAKLKLEQSVATKIVKRQDWQAVKYHDTEVIGWNDERIKLDSGGWPTVTTKRRINQAAARFGLRLHVWQDNGEWLIGFPGEAPIPFYDGILLSRDRANPFAKERDASAGESEYNGWRNRATWNCMLWLNNVQGYYNAYVAAAKRRAFTETSAKRFVCYLFTGSYNIWGARTRDGEPLHRVHWPSIAEAMNEARN